MKLNPVDLKYYKEHTWIRQENDKATLGISDYAQDALGEIIFLDLPAVGAAVEAGKPLGQIESVKATTYVYSAVTGQIIETNQTAIDQPELINQDPYGEGWMVKIKLADLSELDPLMDADEYEKFVAGEES